VTSPLTNRNIVITGGTGSFGKAFAKHALDVGAERVAIFSRDELKQSEMAAAFNDERLRFLLGSVTEPDRVGRALRDVDVVIHAAALKQVPACEANPWEALQTNTVGAQVVAAAAIENNVHRAVYLSTDKAAAPNTLYGATKLCAERIWTQANVYAAGTRTRLVATRYGNVISSRGSVIPLWQQQVETGASVTVTDPDMTRFFMPMWKAVWLVELALSKSRGGEVFVPKVGSCSVSTLLDAVAWARIDTTTIGIRPGEKMHETLISEDESVNTYDCGDHYRIEPHRTWEYLPPLDYDKVPHGWSYRSDTNEMQLDAEAMRELIQ
jgi:UDP-N-acetylglucosamine 4,6-dehydratase